ncbi:hypothetical protein BaRGS_00014554 [Batillaria attramentaria]|uniref:Uncharacterized protein n=1 Tax=Batillaria attramentaria TaxID=370345 RepID=A0ABD0L4J8_9CAEN
MLSLSLQNRSESNQNTTDCQTLVFRARPRQQLSAYLRVNDGSRLNAASADQTDWCGGNDRVLAVAARDSIMLKHMLALNGRGAHGKADTRA